MPTAETTTSRARSLIRRCLTWGVALTALSFLGQGILQTVLTSYLPVGLELAVVSVLGLLRFLGPAVLAVGIVGVGVQLGLAAYGVRPGLLDDDRAL